VLSDRSLGPILQKSVFDAIRRHKERSILTL
jgi:hypothetical protein